MESWTPLEQPLSPGAASEDDDDFGELPINYSAMRFGALDQRPQGLQKFNESAANGELREPNFAPTTEMANTDKCGLESLMAVSKEEFFNQDYQTQLREPTQQTSHVEKCVHSRPVASRACNLCEESERQRKEMWQLAMCNAVQDITTICVNLQIPMDITAWTPEHAARWIAMKCSECGAPPPAFCPPGVTLLKLAPADFDAVAPGCGAAIFESLQLWHKAFSAYQQPAAAAGVPGQLTATYDPSIWPASETSTTTTMTSPSASSSSSSSSSTSSMTLLQQEQKAAMYMQQMCYYPFEQQPLSHLPLPMATAAQPQYYTAQKTEPASDCEEEDEEEEEAVGGGGDPAAMVQLHMANVYGANGQQYTRPGGNVHLWLFIRELLECPEQYGSCVRWVDRHEGTFKIESSTRLATAWGRRKNRAAMNYDKLSRSLRQYYKKGIIQKPEKKQRLVYKFLPPYHQ